MGAIVNCAQGLLEESGGYQGGMENAIREALKEAICEGNARQPPEELLPEWGRVLRLAGRNAGACQKVLEEVEAAFWHTSHPKHWQMLAEATAAARNLPAHMERHCFDELSWRLMQPMRHFGALTPSHCTYPHRLHLPQSVSPQQGLLALAGNREATWKACHDVIFSPFPSGCEAAHFLALIAFPCADSDGARQACADALLAINQAEVGAQPPREQISCAWECARNHGFNPHKGWLWAVGLPCSAGREAVDMVESHLELNDEQREVLLSELAASHVSVEQLEE